MQNIKDALRYSGEYLSANWERVVLLAAVIMAGCSPRERSVSFSGLLVKSILENADGSEFTHFGVVAEDSDGNPVHPKFLIPAESKGPYGRGVPGVENGSQLPGRVDGILYLNSATVSCVYKLTGEDIAQASDLYGELSQPEDGTVLEKMIYQFDCHD